MAVGFLERHGYGVVTPDPNASRTKLLCLTDQGRAAQDEYRRDLDEIETRWQARTGRDAIDRLRTSLEQLFDHADGEPPRLALGLAPAPTGWRNRKQYRTQTDAMQRDPGGSLPHHPMVLHRGGWPDGS